VYAHCNALALYFFHYNFCRIHKSLRTSPAQAAGVTDELLDMMHLCKLMDNANPAKKRAGRIRKTMSERASAIWSGISGLIFFGVVAYWVRAGHLYLGQGHRPWLVTRRERPFLYWGAIAIFCGVATVLLFQFAHYFW
jgi:hypothetical protein